jgi:membrane protein implicated in regulation of membrane protease activity
MSVYSPKRHDLATFGRQRASAATGFVGMFVQAFVVGVSALVIFGAYHFGQVWLAGIAFLILAAISSVVYWLILNKAARAAMDRREVLVAEICRVSADSTASGRVS